MALRLINLHRQSLLIDLAGGAVLLLAPGERSAPLREEVLYENYHLPEWERAGWIVRVAARMDEVLANEAEGGKGAPPTRAPAADAAAAPAVTTPDAAAIEVTTPDAATIEVTTPDVAAVAATTSDAATEGRGQKTTRKSGSAG